MSFRIVETLLSGALRLPWLGRGIEMLLETTHAGTVRALRRARRDLIRPREWSNAELRRVAPYFDGRIINVSGWRDEDKVGGHYRDYFTCATAYDISNRVLTHAPQRVDGHQGGFGDVPLVMGAWMAVAMVTEAAPSSAAKSMVERVSATARSAVLGSVRVLKVGE